MFTGSFFKKYLEKWLNCEESCNFFLKTTVQDLLMFSKMISI